MDPAEIRRLWDEAGAAHENAAAGLGLMGFEVVHEASALGGAAVAVVGLPVGGWAEAAAAVRSASARYRGWIVAGRERLRAVDYGDVAVDGGDLAATFVRAHERLADIFAVGATPLVLGGDAVVSLPVLQVLSGKLRGRLGVIAFTPSYEIVPEPVYAAVSRWARALELGVVAPENLVLVGGRTTPTDACARRVLGEIGASTFSVAEIAEHGMQTIARESLEVAAAGTEAVYLSVDLSVLEGVGDPVGLTARELASGAAAVGDALLAAADVCGLAMIDGDRQAAVAARVAAEIVAGISRRLA